MAWLSTEAVRTGSRELVLGKSLYEFMRTLGMEDRSGSPRGDRTRLRNQMKRLFGCSVSLIYEDKHGSPRFVSSHIAESGEFWWNPKRPDRAGAVGQQDSTERAVLQRDHQPPRTN